MSSRVSSVRLYILGILEARGPMNGHQIRRQAQIDRTELWTDIKVGSLYAALHRLAEDGLIEAARTAAEGNMPARTVYDSTPEGHKELVVLRSSTRRATSLRPDP